MNLAWQDVKCKDCGRQYRCTPADDYYDATDGTDGVCLACQLVAHGLARDTPVVTVGHPDHSTEEE